MYVTSYDLLIYIHTLLFVYWLGGDLGVYLSAKFVADRNLSIEERFRFMHVLMQCDMGPRTALIGLIPLGFQMAWMQGLSPIGGPPLVVIWVCALTWLAANWWMFFNERHPMTAKLKGIDMYIRYAVILGMGGLGLMSLITEAPIQDKWLASKIFLFGCAVVLGVYLRGEIKNWVIGFGMVRAGGDEATKGNDIIEAASGRSKVAALMLWTIVAVIAFLGKVKPF
ncbi:MAG: hypothetical protein OSB02_08830 [Rhodospirillaceae bacterium]|jgi:hypothetical protein|nr:hypothetical protein [Rhodospirillaceae bacterium]